MADKLRNHPYRQGARRAFITSESSSDVPHVRGRPELGNGVIDRSNIAPTPERMEERYYQSLARLIERSEPEPRPARWSAGIFPEHTLVSDVGIHPGKPRSISKIIGGAENHQSGTRNGGLLSVNENQVMHVLERTYPEDEPEPNSGLYTNTGNWSSIRRKNRSLEDLVSSAKNKTLQRTRSFQVPENRALDAIVEESQNELEEPQQEKLRLVYAAVIVAQFRKPTAKKADAERVPSGFYDIESASTSAPSHLESAEQERTAEIPYQQGISSGLKEEQEDSPLSESKGAPREHVKNHDISHHSSSLVTCHSPSKQEADRAKRLEVAARYRIPQLRDTGAPMEHLKAGQKAEHLPPALKPRKASLVRPGTLEDLPSPDLRAKYQSPSKLQPSRRGYEEALKREPGLTPEWYLHGPGAVVKGGETNKPKPDTDIYRPPPRIQRGGTPDQLHPTARKWESLRGADEQTEKPGEKDTRPEIRRIRLPRNAKAGPAINERTDRDQVADMNAGLREMVKAEAQSQQLRPRGMYDNFAAGEPTGRFLAKANKAIQRSEFKDVEYTTEYTASRRPQEADTRSDRMVNGPGVPQTSDAVVVGDTPGLHARKVNGRWPDNTGAEYTFNNKSGKLVWGGNNRGADDGRGAGDLASGPEGLKGLSNEAVRDPVKGPRGWKE